MSRTFGWKMGIHGYLEYACEHLLTILTWGVVLAGLCEGLWGLLQLCGVVPSGHPDYMLTGSFYNPGPYGCFLAVVFPLALRKGISSGVTVSGIAGTVVAVLCVMLIPLTMSRGALVTAGAGTLIIFSDKAAEWIRTRRIRHRRMWPAAVVAAAMCLAAAGTALYLVKKDSADGRLLMWKVAASAVPDVPPRGAGWDRVPGVYAEAQERYFASGKGTEQEMMVAGTPGYVFNEYLQVALAYGPAASLLMTALIAGAVTVAFRHRRYGLAGSVAAAAIVMTVSYPLQFPVFAVTIAAAVTAAYASSPRLSVALPGTALSVAMCAALLADGRKETTDVESGFLAARMLRAGGEYRKSNVCLMRLMPYSGDPMILNVMARNYRDLGMADSAAFWLGKSVARCPARMYPRYLLMKLYGDTASGDPGRCLKMAREILAMRVKVPSPAVDSMRGEAKRIVNEYKDKNI